MTVDLDALREQIIEHGLSESEVDADPFAQVRSWLALAEAAGVHEPSAITLATVDATGAPDARMVLLRRIDDHGLHWYTDRTSAKGQQLASAPRAALVLAWPVLGRQVRAVGPVVAASDAESDAYWATRPRGSQLAATTSHQSQVLADRAELDAAYAATEARFDGGEIPRPATWGGYILTPLRIELWQQRPFRMHDRLRYERADERDGWRVVRLSP